MQKPWSFRAVEFLTYVQIGFALLVSGYAIAVLVANEAETLQRVLLSRSTETGFWGLLGYIEPGKFGVDRVLAVALTFFFEFLVSSIILFVLKRKNLIALRITAILALVLRTASFWVGSGYGYVNPFSRYLTYPDQHFVIPFIFILGSIFIVVFSFLKPVQYYMQIRSRRHNISIETD